LSELTSSKPYLLRAVHEWLTDNGLTPQIVVDTEVEGVQVPPGHASDGRIVLNVSLQAVRDLQLGNHYVEFGARFSGRPMQVSVPIRSVLAMLARENGVGMSFPESPGDDPPPEGGQPETAVSSRPSLRVVK
jgi:stringent starvation protein B